MNQISFSNDSSGPQFGINHGVINVLCGTFLKALSKPGLAEQKSLCGPDRTEPPQQRVDNGSLRPISVKEIITYYRGRNTLVTGISADARSERECRAMPYQYLPMDFGVRKVPVLEERVPWSIVD